MEYNSLENFHAVGDPATTTTTAATTTTTAATTTPATTTTTTPATTTTTPPPATTQPPATTTPPPATTTPPPATTTSTATPTTNIYYDSNGNRVYYDRYGYKHYYDVNRPPPAADMFPPPDRPVGQWNGWGNWNNRPIPPPNSQTQIDIDLTRRGEHRGYFDYANMAGQATSTDAGWSIFGIFIGILILIWVIAGVIAFFASLICMFYNGSVTDKTIGFMMSVLFGPFYWLYYIYNANYCTRY